MRIVFSVIAVFSALALSGCATVKGVFHKNKPVVVGTLELDVSARALINQDANNRPYSVSVRAWQLRDRTAFDGASYDDLFNKDKDVLGDTYRDSVSAVIEPSGATSLNQPLKSDSCYIAVAAFFRNISASHGWRLVVPRTELLPDLPLRFELINSDLKQIPPILSKKQKDEARKAAKARERKGDDACN